jgi:hypothetical protein
VTTVVVGGAGVVTYTGLSMIVSLTGRLQPARNTAATDRKTIESFMKPPRIIMR